MSRQDDTARPADDSARRAVAAVWRVEGAKIVATLTRVTGDFVVAEDLAQDALREALTAWPTAGVPANPAAWLVAVAKRRAIDRWRREERDRERLAELAFRVERGDDTTPWEPDEITDDVLRLVFIACHPSITPQAQVALTLRVVAGLTTEQIAAAFLTPVTTMQQRIVRAKKTISAAGARFAMPTPDEYPARLHTVLAVVYLLFTEGHAARDGTDPLRVDLAAEALRLGRSLVAHLPREPELQALLALLELTAARFPARIDPAGETVLLEDQDRRRWDQGAIRRGRAALAEALRIKPSYGTYALQAAIAEQHAIAASVADTDWARIAALYGGLAELTRSPIVELNRAVAVAQADGSQAGLDLVDALLARGDLADHHLPPAVRGELLTRLGRIDEARDALTLAIDRTANAGERRVLERKRASL